MRYTYLLCVLFFATASYAQHPLEGLWQGELVDSLGTHRFELLLRLREGKVSGHSYYYHEDRLVTEMEVKGKFHRDHSVSLYDIRLIGGEDLLLTGKDPYMRTYQLLFKRSVFGSSVKGFWQINDGTVGSRLRKVGRIELQKMKAGKA